LSMATEIRFFTFITFIVVQMVESKLPKIIMIFTFWILKPLI
jgi:hypothetical protein